MPLTPKVMRIMSLIEQQPRYGKELLDIDPECFATPAFPEPALPRVYQALRSMERRGLIERVHNYKPPKSRPSEHHQTRALAVWYRLTAYGKSELALARALLAPHMKQPPATPAINHDEEPPPPARRRGGNRRRNHAQ